MPTAPAHTQGCCCTGPPAQPDGTHRAAGHLLSSTGHRAPARLAPCCVALAASSCADEPWLAALHAAPTSRAGRGSRRPACGGDRRLPRWPCGSSSWAGAPAPWAGAVLLCEAIICGTELVLQELGSQCILSRSEGEWQHGAGGRPAHARVAVAGCMRRTRRVSRCHHTDALVQLDALGWLFEFAAGGCAVRRVGAWRTSALWRGTA